MQDMDRLRVLKRLEHKDINQIEGGSRAWDQHASFGTPCWTRWGYWNQKAP